MEELTARVKEISGTTHTSWGDPNRFDDWQTNARILGLELSEKDRKRGYNLESITIWFEPYEINTGSEPTEEGTPLEGIKVGDEIKIRGPLYRGDMAYGWREHPLKEKPEKIKAAPGPVRTSAHEEKYDPSEERQLEEISIKTAKSANALLRESPIYRQS